MTWYPNFQLYILYSVKLESNFNMLRSLSRYHFDIKLSIYVQNMLTKFYENQGPVTYLSYRNVKTTITMFQCKTYLSKMIQYGDTSTYHI